MNERELQNILEAVHSGEVSPAHAVERLKHLPFEDLDFAKVDHHRALRQGYAEVIFGKGKTPEQVAEIVRSMLRHEDGRQNILGTRGETKICAAVRRVNFGKTSRRKAGEQPGTHLLAQFHPLSGVITVERSSE